MAYIGVAPSSGLFKKLDSITTVNAQAAYTMQYNSSNFKPATAEQLIVSVNGVIQAPADAYTVSGSTITFSENLVTGDVIDFIVALGEVGNTVTPVDGSVDINKMSASLMTESGGETTLKIDNIQNSSGTSAISIDSSGNVSLANKAGQVLETLAMACDGEDYTVLSGTYTSQNVTGVQLLTTTFTEATGSSVNYTPPAGTKCVVYDFDFQRDWSGDERGIIHFSLQVDGTEVSNSRTTSDGEAVFSGRMRMRWVIPIGGTANTNTGRQASWTSGKVIRMMAREYSSAYEGKLHQTNFWDGGGTDVFSQPNLTITAIG